MSLPVKEASGLRNLGVWGEQPEVGAETKGMCFCHFPEALGRGQR